jgi:ceramide kinase
MSVPAVAAACSSTTATPAASSAAAAAADAADGPPGPGWVKLEGQYCSIMCVVTSCISDKSRQGLMPEAHLADGRLALVMVEGCSRLQYLRFLIQLASKGIVPGSLPFVKVEYATEVQVEAQGRHSSWNVDGELLRHGRVNVGIHAGLVDVFARGVELM